MTRSTTTLSEFGLEICFLGGRTWRRERNIYGWDSGATMNSVKASSCTLLANGTAKLARKFLFSCGHPSRSTPTTHPAHRGCVSSTTQSRFHGQDEGGFGKAKSLEPGKSDLSKPLTNRTENRRMALQELFPSNPMVCLLRMPTLWKLESHGKNCFRISKDDTSCKGKTDKHTVQGKEKSLCRSTSRKLNSCMPCIHSRQSTGTSGSPLLRASASCSRDRARFIARCDSAPSFFIFGASPGCQPNVQRPPPRSHEDRACLQGSGNAAQKQASL